MVAEVAAEVAAVVAAVVVLVAAAMSAPHPPFPSRRRLPTTWWSLSADATESTDFCESFSLSAICQGWGVGRGGRWYSISPFLSRRIGVLESLGKSCGIGFEQTLWLFSKTVSTVEKDS
jgi:hypothetical protein